MPTTCCANYLCYLRKMDKQILSTEPREILTVNPRLSAFGFKRTDTSEEVPVLIAGDVTNGNPHYEAETVKNAAWQAAFETLQLGLPTDTVTLDRNGYDRFRLTGSVR
jgi:hypothetical protein